MLAMNYRGPYRVRTDEKPMPKILHPEDAINVVEVLVADLAQGTMPNVPAEMGARSEWEHNRQGFVAKAGVTLAIGALVFAAVRRRGRRQDW